MPEHTAYGHEKAVDENKVFNMISAYLLKG
jgi:hypothetical protein